MSRPRPSCAAVFLLAALSSLSACSGGADTPTYVRDIKPLVDTKCAGCHSPGNIAPFPLQTYEEVSANRERVAAAVVARTMPPWMASRDCSDYAGDRSLTQEQIDMVKRWADAGAPLGDPNSTPIPVADERLSLSRVDQELAMPVPYTPQTFPDDYRCFFLDFPTPTNIYVTGLGVAPGNAAIAHHVIAYVVRPANIAKFQALDDADPAPGWSCFGSPLGNTGTPTANLFSWLGGWSPGVSGTDFPEGTGIEIPAGSKLVVQMHYYSTSRTPASDRTTIRLRTATSVQKKATFLPYANPQWVMGDMKIPAGMSDVVHSYANDPTVLVGFLTGGALPSGKPLTIYDVGHHMHLMAERGLARLEHANGQTECLLDIPRWNFHWQGSYRFRTPKRIVPGDKLYLECQWDNPSNKDVTWGEGTGDEMCLGIYYLTE